MRIKFSESVIYESEGRNKGPRFEAGVIYDMSDEMAGRWKRRGVAEDAPAEPVAPVAEVERFAEPVTPAVVVEHQHHARPVARHSVAR